MHLRLNIVAFVVIAFASLALGATTTKKPATTKAGATTKKAATTKAAAKTTTKAPVKCNCTNAFISIYSCLDLDAELNNWKLYWEYYELYNMSAMTTLLTGLKNSKCINASAWPDIQGWITLYTPPACFMNIINGLTAAQKSSIKAWSDQTNDDPKVDAAYEKVENVINTKVASFSAANNKTYNAWIDTLWDYCGEFYYLEEEYAYSYSTSSSS